MAEYRKLKDVAQGRWSEIAILGLENWDVIYWHGEGDYQGSCEYIVRHPYYGYGQGEWVTFGWSYGSCSGCDGYEDQPRNKVIQDMMVGRTNYTNTTIKVYAENILAENPEGNEDFYWRENPRVKALAILKALGETDEE